MRRSVSGIVVVLLILSGAIGSVEAQESDPPAGANLALVQAAYEGLLGRAPESEGATYWAGLIDGGSRAGDVIGVIGDADEHRRFVVRRFYRQILDREPDAGGLHFWSDGIIDRLTARRLAIEIYSSEEFFQRSGATNVGFVANLYRNTLNREPEGTGLAYWVGLLDDGIARSTVTRLILDSTEGILQPDLSVEASEPTANSSGAADRISVDLDRVVDVAATAVIVSVGGVRVPGSVAADPADASRLRFSADNAVAGEAGDDVVVTVFATSRSADGAPFVESVDFGFTLDPAIRPAPQDPEGELIVAFYGHPRTGVLGVAGEGTPAEALLRLQAQAAPYEVTGRRIVPAFEMIATLVTAGPGADRLYRNRATEEELRRYLEAIRTVEGRLILDIQPGRADVLDEARAYEALLLEPEVGLALDPEWVVGPTQTPAGRIGRLDAEAINRVAGYLSELVAANSLPPKILIVHRFNPGMVTNSDEIVSLPGVRILFHADGEGGPAAKIDDYDNLLPDRFERGIKVFYDEDSPTMTPTQLLGLTNPDPTFISYQ